MAVGTIALQLIAIAGLPSIGSHELRADPDAGSVTAMEAWFLVLVAVLGRTGAASVASPGRNGWPDRGVRSKTGALR
jgi:hypothetical protein